MSKRPIPKNKREYAAALKRAKARTFLEVVNYLERWPNRTLVELAKEFKFYASACEEDAQYAETERSNADRMIEEVLG